MFPIITMVACFWMPTFCFAHYESMFDRPAVLQITEPFELSEGPVWDPRRNLLFFVDIHSGRVFSYNYHTGALRNISLDGNVTPVIPSKNNKILIVGLNRSVVALEWDGTNELGKQKVLTTVSRQYPHSRFNDGKADKNGRLWFGTTGEDPGTKVFTPNLGVLYKITKRNFNDPFVELAPVNISNGLAWNSANNKFYYIDSKTRQVAEFDYNHRKGAISSRRVLIDLNDHPDVDGVPDGMTIDVDDNLWVALYGGGSILHVSTKTGHILQRIALPSKHVTSAAWGGPKFDILFVTTARQSLTSEERHFYPAAGSVFAITNLKTRGSPAYYADIIDSV